jgi:hypothetical protein
MAARDKRGGETEIVEHGDIYFFYRPKVDTEGAEGLDDVQRCHVVLRPHGRGLFRLITIGRKRLPDIGQHERTWGFVYMVAKSAREIEQALRQQSYDTKRAGNGPDLQRARPGRASMPWYNPGASCSLSMSSLLLTAACRGGRGGRVSHRCARRARRPGCRRPGSPHSLPPAERGVSRRPEDR